MDDSKKKILVQEILAASAVGRYFSIDGWNKEYTDSIELRILKRAKEALDRSNDIRNGRVIPESDNLKMGTGSRLELAIMFFDICSFTKIKSTSEEEQRQVLCLFHIVMAEFYQVVRDFGGQFEKNTGDGFMAYFHDRSTEQMVKKAVSASLVIHYVNDFVLPGILKSLDLPTVKIRVGIDVGEVTLGRVGIDGGYNHVVAIGSPANSACKVMGLVKEYGGIAIGDAVYRSLKESLKGHCSIASINYGFVYLPTLEPYPGWNLNYRLVPIVSTLLSR